MRSCYSYKDRCFITGYDKEQKNGDGRGWWVREVQVQERVV